MAKANPKETAPSLDNPGKAVAPEIAANSQPDAATARQRDDEAQAQKIFDALKGERMTGGNVFLSRRSTGEGDFGHLGVVPVEDYSVEMVKGLYGGGDFKATAKSANGQIVTSWGFKIDHRIPAKHPDAVAPRQESEVAAVLKEFTAAFSARQTPAPATDNSALLGVLQMMNAQILAAQAASAEMMKAVFQRPTAPAVDPALTQILNDMRREISELKSNRGGGAGELLKTVELIDKLRESGGEEKTSFATDLGKGLASAAPQIFAMISGGGNPPPMLPAPGTETGLSNALPETQTTQPAPAESQNMDASTRFMIARFKSAAIEAARKMKDPDQFVDGLFSMVPDSFHAKVYQLANAPTWFADIFGADNEAAKAIDWLRSMRNAVLTRAFVTYAQNYHAQQKTPADCAAGAITQIDPGFHDELFNLTDPDNWKAVFNDSKISPDWLESLRVAIDRDLSGESQPEPEKPAGNKPKK